MKNADDDQLIRTRLAMNIRWHRIHHATQGEAAKFLGVSQGNYSRIESGEVVPSAIQMVYLSRLFKCTVADLFNKA